MMQIYVRVNGVLAQKIGIARFPVTLSEQTTIADLVSYLKEQHPAAESIIGRAVPFVSGQHEESTTILNEGQEVALLIPIAGG